MKKKNKGKKKQSKVQRFNCSSYGLVSV